MAFPTINYGSGKLTTRLNSGQMCLDVHWRFSLYKNKTIFDNNNNNVPLLTYPKGDTEIQCDQMLE